MERIRIKIEPIEIMNALIISFEDDLYKITKHNRFTKFDSDNDSFLGTIGEIAFKKYLLSIGYKYGIDFWDNYNLPVHTKINIDGKLYDKYDFGINIGLDYFKIDVKTQYCINIDIYNENWQMAVNHNTIEKIKSKNRELDSFMFIFSDKDTLKYKKHIFSKSNTKNIEENIKWLNENKLNSELLFKSFDVDLVGIINVNNFINGSSLFKKDEIFRVNFTKEGIPLKWKCETDMYRIYIKYITNISRFLCPKDIKNLKVLDPENFKVWFENIFVCETNCINVEISENVYIKVPQDGIINGMQFETFKLFFKEMSNKFNLSCKNSSI